MRREDQPAAVGRDGRRWIEAFLEMMSAERGAAANTLAAYRRDLDDASAVLGGRLSSADAAGIRMFLDGVAAQGLSASTQARKLSTLRQFFKFLYVEGLRQNDPSGVIDSPRKERTLPRTVSEDDAARLLGLAEQEAREGSAAALRLHALVEVLYATGLRVSELVSLPVSVALRDERYFTVRGKGNKERIVPLSAKARAAMTAWLAARKRLCRRRRRPVAVSLGGASGHLPRQVFARELRGSARGPAFRPGGCRRTCCATPSPAISCRTAPTCAPCSSFSGIPTSRRRRSTPMCWRKGSRNWSTRTIRLPTRLSTAI